MGRLEVADGQSPAEFQRDVLLHALHELYVPAHRDELQAYAAVYAEVVGDLPPLSEIVAEELLAWRSGRSTEVVLCPALVGPGGQADDSYLTRSDWKLENRLVDDARDEGRHLWLVRIFCDQYMIAEDEGMEGLAILADQIRRHVELVRQRFSDRVVSFLEDEDDELDIGSVEQLREAAEDAYSEFAATDRPMRQQLADQLADFPEQRKLFGA